MSGHEPGTDGDDPLIDEAAAWLAKLRLSSGPREREAFETWYAADRAHADAYDKVLRGWNASGSSGDPASDLVPHSPQRATPGPPVPHAMAIADAVLLILLTGLSPHWLGMFGSRTRPGTALPHKK